jgi:hypothetical protein
MTKLILSIIFCFIFENCFALVGNVTALNSITPTPRSAAMGSVGYALGDDETCLMFNPAGLGFTNFRWIGGAISYTLANQFIPSENLYTIAYQNEYLPGLGFSASLDQTDQSMERTIIGPDFGIYPNGELTSHNSYYGMGAGYRFYSNKALDNSIGTSINYYRETSDPSMSPLETSVFGNIGYIMQIYNKFRIGLSFKNIEIARSTISNSSGNYSSPTAFCIGLGYKDSFYGKEFKALDISMEFSYVDQFSSTNWANSIQTGCEATFFNTFSVRFGNQDYPGASEYSFSFGAGLSFYNHLGIDYYYVNEKISNEARNYSGFSLSFNRILTWSKSDLRWWLK